MTRKRERQSFHFFKIMSLSLRFLVKMPLKYQNWSPNKNQSMRLKTPSKTRKSGFVFSPTPLCCNQNVIVHNASMVLFGVVARHCLPDKALYDLLKWHKIFHPQDSLAASNFIKNETRKLNDRYIKGTEPNGSGEFVFCEFCWWNTGKNWKVYKWNSSLR